jgi:hypothetical protein
VDDCGAVDELLCCAVDELLCCAVDELLGAACAPSSGSTYFELVLELVDAVVSSELAVLAVPVREAVPVDPCAPLLAAAWTPHATAATPTPAATARDRQVRCHRKRVARLMIMSLLLYLRFTARHAVPRSLSRPSPP